MRSPLIVATAIFALGSTASGQERSASLAADPWLATGNAVGGGNFLGTTNGAPLVFKADGREAMRILPNLDIGIGTTAPNSPLTVNAATPAPLVLMPHTGTVLEVPTALSGKLALPVA